ncbi:non-ribosomal peptide synthetase [Pseudoalteromonas sp. MMG022]|uniref:non-ribosomal peptide synthetase n=1 Tax=Pseudoalteromonas sp. MMG022 TaxID=2909978 RepID=UPI001F474B3D|nr:non-ribosomal peptide synthetase [Pseudoalteromonas sp. MMG022]MCF6434835.1 amino acid adenylation domain-containing protein [Pseudoalteromonas sp. MMG022]
MTLTVLKQAQAQGVLLYLENNKLKARAAKGAMTDELKKSIVEHKEGLVALMSRFNLLNLNDEMIEQQQTYWLEQLADSSEQAWQVPLSKRAANSKGAEYAQHSVTLDAGLLAQLDAFAIAKQTDRFAVLHSALCAQLNQYSGVNDCVVAQHLQGGLGYCADDFDNRVALRMKMTDDASFEDYLSCYEQQRIAALNNASLTTGLLAEALQKDERSSVVGQPRIFSGYYEQASIEHNYDEGCDLSVSFMADSSSLEVVLHYNTQCVSDTFVKRFVANFQALIACVLNAQTQPLNDLALLSDFEYDELQYLAQGVEDTRHSQYHCVLERFNRWVESTPSAIAVTDQAQSLSYAQLDSKANQVAYHLLDAGVQVGDVVAVSMARSVDFMVAILGVLKSGAAYLPIDPSYPADRVQHMLNDSQARMLLNLSDNVMGAEFSGTIMSIDTLTETQACALPQNQADDLAYVIYTSGSTGLPKGVALSHRGALNLFFNQLDCFKMSEQSRVLQFASISFDAATWEWMMALLAGSSLYICPESARTSTQELADYLVDNGVTHATLPPSLLTHMDIERDYQFDALIVAGEAIETALAWRWAEKFPLYNGYGPSESTVCASVDRIVANEVVTIGSALANLSLYVVAPNTQQLVPRGAAGELLIAGASLAKGYLHNEKLTARSFIESDLGMGKVQRLYRTGDYVRLLENGKLEFLGRIDNQIQFNGFRIELGEIEQVIQAQEGVKSALVILDPHSQLKRLVAYVIKEGETLDSSAVLSGAKDQLPDYMVPATVVTVDSYPLTANGKVDAAKLPVADLSAGNAYVAPTDELQTLLCEQWQQLLMVEKVGITDSFFELGGDSILSIQAVARANQKGINITTKGLLKLQTIEKLTADLAEQAPQEVKATQEALTGNAPLLPIQQAYLDNTQVDHHYFNQAVLLSVPSGLNHAMLTRIVNAMVTRHDAMRLGFKQDEQGQWHAQYQTFTEQQIDACCMALDLPEDVEQHAKFIEQVGEQYQSNFALMGDPLVRAVLLHSKDTQYVLFVAHHLIIDGMSWRVLLQDLMQAYGQLSQGHDITLGAKTSSYQQWTEALANYQDAAQDIWALSQPTDSIESDFEQLGDNTQASTQMWHFELNEKDTQALLKECPSSYNTTINELLLSALAQALHQWQAVDNVSVMLESHGREPLFDDIDTSQTVGWFTSIYPLVLNCADVEIGATIKDIKERYRAVPNNGIGFGYWAQRNPELASQYNPQILFNYLGQFDQAVDNDSGFAFAEGNLGKAVSDKHQREYLLGINSLVSEGRLSVALDYSENRFKADNIQSLGNLLEQALIELVAHCKVVKQQYTPSDFPLASMTQKELDVLQQQHDIAKLYPATSMQKGMMFQSLVKNDAYLTQSDFVFTGEINLAYFQQAWQSVIDRFDVFRTVFVGSGESLHQLVVKQATLPWHVEDLRALNEQQQLQRFDEYRRQDRQQGVDLANSAPMMRVVIFQLADDKYRLLWTHHHILLDGWSLPIVYGAVVESYECLMEGKALVTTPSGDYESYIAWLGERSQSDAQQYWRSQLGHIDNPTPLNIDKLPTDGETGHHVQRQLLSKEQTERLKDFAASAQVTVNTLLQFAWGYLLHRYSNEDQVVFGSIVSGRPGELLDVEQMVGLFINNIPVVLNLDNKQSIKAQLQAMHANFQEANEHCYVPLNEIQSYSEVEGGYQLFDSIFSFENYPLDAAVSAEKEASIAVESVDAFEENEYKLTINAGLSETLIVRCSYYKEQFAQSTVERVLEHYIQILLQLPQCEQLTQVELLTEQEQTQLLSMGEQHSSYEVTRCIHEQFEAQVAQYPDAVAVVCDDQQLTYSQLNERANQIAHYLMTQGVEADELVGLYAERSLEMIVGILAILKSGAAYVPLDPDYPDSRIEYMLEDSDIRIVLTQSHLQETIPTDQQLLVLVDEPERYEGFRKDNISAEEANVSVGDLAYVIYTSGSTGKPKGVLVEHRNVLRLFSSSDEHFDFKQTDVWSLFHSISFDFSVWEIWGALFYGAKLVVVPKEVAKETERFSALVNEQQVTVLSQTPAAFELFSQQDQLESHDSLRYVVFGGAALNFASLKPWIARHGDDAPQLINMYGITETTVHVTYKRVTKEHVMSEQGSMIGFPLLDLSSYVLDQDQQFVAIGVPGELYVGGDGVTRGYLNRDDLTERAFIDNPFKPSERLYRTGDLVKRIDTGELVYLGRIDDQVKIRGFRIELGEIEHQIRDHHSVNEVLVLTQGESHDKRLVAYLVLTEGQDELQAVAELKASISQNLAPHMVPAAFVVIDKIPLTINGKVNRKALPEADFSASVEDYQAPETAVEAALADIWQQVLKVARVGISDNFFALGGDSIRAISLVAKMKESGYSVSIGALFENPTIKQLASVVALEEVTSLPEVPAFSMLEEQEYAKLREQADFERIEDAYPMTQLQQGMVFHNLLAGGQGIYHDVMSFKIKSAFDAQTFAQAVTSLAQRHQILRTLFVMDSHAPTQLVYKQLDVEPVVMSLMALTEQQQNAHLTQWIEEEKNSPFDFTKPLWRIYIHQLDAECFQYTISFHHALFDGWSIATLNTQLFNEYIARREGTYQASEEVVLPYKYLVHQEQAAMQSQEVRDYWRSKLEDAQLPWWAGKTLTGKSRQVLDVSPESSQKIRDLAKQLGVQERSILLTTHVVLLALVNGNKDVVTSVVANCRPEYEGADKTLGLFLNSLPFVTSLEDHSWQALIKQVDAQVSQDASKRTLPLSVMQKDAGLDFSSSLFNYVDFHVYENLADDIEVMGAQGSLEQNYLISVTYSKVKQIAQDTFNLTLDIDQDTFGEAMAERMLQYSQRIIDSIVQTPSNAISFAALMSQDEMAQQLAHWNDTARQDDQNATVHQGIFAQASKTPDAIAVQAGEEKLSYQQLVDKATRMSAYFESQGLTKGDRIGLYMPRCPQLMVTLLAAMNSGLVYVPIDLKNTQQRVEKIVASSELKLMVSVSDFTEQTATCGVDVMLVDDALSADWLAHVVPMEQLAGTASAQDSVYVIYTSGSTGEPKGVEIHHQGLMDYCQTGLDLYYNSDLTGSLVVTSHAFDLTVPSLYLPLLAGGTVHLSAMDEEISGLHRALTCGDEQQYLMRMTPMHVNAMLALMEPSFVSKARHVFVIGGESFAPSDARKLQSFFPQSEIYNHYGPSESVVGCTIANVSELLNDDIEVLPIGRAMPNTRLYVLSPEQEVVPVGCVGELYIAGNGVAKGYLNRPDLTAERFVEKSFANGVTERLYRTGDLVRYDELGQLYYMGRTDQQIKVRGYRVEPAEIEQVLMKQSEINSALVMMLKDGKGEAQLVAYVTTYREAMVHNDWLVELKARLGQSLPNYMVPSAIVHLDNMPLSINGKVDRKALPKPDVMGVQNYVEPASETEHAVASIFADILNVEQVGRHDDFFALGGHSLNATRFVGMVREVFAIELPLVEVFNHPDVMHLAQIIDEIVTLSHNVVGLDEQSELVEMQW